MFASVDSLCHFRLAGCIQNTKWFSWLPGPLRAFPTLSTTIYLYSILHDFPGLFNQVVIGQVRFSYTVTKCS